jgi:PD-(D/E)XK nuclease superfamily
MKRQILHEELSGQIIGAAMAVLNKLKPGLDEKLYERAMVIELRGRGPDLIVDNSIIVDAKVVSGFNDTHVAQMIGYLSISGLQLGLLLNFQGARLDWKRVVRQHKAELDVPDLHASAVLSAKSA